MTVKNEQCLLHDAFDEKVSFKVLSRIDPVDEGRELVLYNLERHPQYLWVSLEKLQERKSQHHLCSIL